jgi:hypothetical protein
MAENIIFKDGLTSKSQKEVEGNIELKGIFVSSKESNGEYEGTAGLKTYANTAKSFITLPPLDSVGELTFWVKAVDADVIPIVVRKKVGDGAWETVTTVSESDKKKYVKKTIALNVAAKDVLLQLYMEKEKGQGGYYIDDFMVTGCTGCTLKDASFAPIFTRNMVLQRDEDVKIWGVASGEFPLTLEIQGQQLKSIPKGGKFEFTTKPLKAGGPYTMKLSWDGGFKQLDEVYVGDVWLAGGQSNMAFQMKKVENFENEERAKSNYPNIKYFTVPRNYYEGHGKTSQDWVSCTPEEVGEAYAVAYYFAREVCEDQQIPIGIVQCAVGGTSAESWMSRELLMSGSHFKKEVVKYDSIVNSYKSGEYEELLRQFNAKELKKEPMGPKNFRRPAGLYYTMFKDIVVPFTVKGIIFYQGESNVRRGYIYRFLVPELIRQWREDLQQGDVPFLLVQLPKYRSKEILPTAEVAADLTSSYFPWAEIRESQLLISQKVKNSGMSVAFDQGNDEDIHPTRKDTVGMRLAKVALAKVYGRNIPYSGPEYKGMDVRDGKITLHFNHIDGGLVAKGAGGELKGFTICGEDGKFVPAEAVIQGNVVVVSNSQVSEPVHVRYGWFNTGEMNLYNKADLPASSFRTDDFKLLTQDF